MLSENNKDKREGDRVATELPVDLAGVTGVTRDVSASGIFFEADVDLSVGSSVSFDVEFLAPAGRMVLKCRGEVVRLESRGFRQGVAVKIIESTIELAQ